VINEQLDKAYADFLDAIRPELDAFNAAKQKSVEKPEKAAEAVESNDVAKLTPA
jgi:hypothetical protein